MAVGSPYVSAFQDERPSGTRAGEKRVTRSDHYLGSVMRRRAITRLRCEMVVTLLLSRSSYSSHCVMEACMLRQLNGDDGSGRIVG